MTNGKVFHDGNAYTADLGDAYDDEDLDQAADHPPSTTRARSRATLRKSGQGS